MIIVVTVRPRVGLVTLTLTFKVKVIPRSNAPNDSKVFANMSESASGPCLSVSKQFGSLGPCGPKITKMLVKNLFFIGYRPYLNYYDPLDLSYNLLKNF